MRSISERMRTKKDKLVQAFERDNKKREDGKPFKGVPYPHQGPKVRNFTLPYDLLTEVRSTFHVVVQQISLGQDRTAGTL